MLGWKYSGGIVIGLTRLYMPLTALLLRRSCKAAAQSAGENYDKGQLDAAALNLRRRRQLFSLGSASKFDVGRAEKKLVQLQQDSSTPR